MMRKVFTTVPGLSLRIGNFGVASDVVPCEVPEEVAIELRDHPQLKIEGGAKPAKRTIRPGKYTRDELAAEVANVAEKED